MRLARRLGFACLGATASFLHIDTCICISRLQALVRAWILGAAFVDFYGPFALRAAACLSKAVKFAQLRAFMLSCSCAGFALRLLVFRAQTSVLKFYKIYASPQLRIVCGDGSQALRPFI